MLDFVLHLSALNLVRDGSPGLMTSAANRCLFEAGARDAQLIPQPSRNLEIRVKSLRAQATL